MATVKWNSIGSMNQQLVLDLIAGKGKSGGYPVDKEPSAGWLHGPFAYNILEYGLYGYQQRKMLGSEWHGTKYYCFNARGINMKQRLVHIYKKTSGSKTDHHFYRLIHTEGSPGCYTNDYQSCEEVVDIDKT